MLHVDLVSDSAGRGTSPLSMLSSLLIGTCVRHTPVSQDALSSISLQGGHWRSTRCGFADGALLALAVSSDCRAVLAAAAPPAIASMSVPGRSIRAFLVLTTANVQPRAVAALLSLSG
jgi:hypothetical protein